METINNKLKIVGGIWLVLSIFALIFSYDINPIQPAMYSKLLGLQLVSVLSLCAFVVSSAKHLYLPKQKAVWLYVVFIILLIPSVVFAINPGKAWSDYFKIVTFFFIFLLAYTLLSQNDFKKVFTRLITVFAFLSLTIAAVQLYALLFSINPKSLLQIQRWFGQLTSSDELHQQTYFIKSVFAHRNLFAQVLLLCSPFLLFSVIKEKGFWRIFAFLVLLVSLIPMAFLFVRTIWVISVVTILIGAFVWLLSGGFERFSWRHYTGIGVITICIVLGALSFVNSNDKLQETFVKQGYWMNDPTLGSVQERLVMWNATLPMVKENWLFGVGPNNWAIAFPNYYHQEVRKGEDGLYYQFQRPHNDYLQMMAEYGVIAFLVFLSFVLIGVFSLLRIVFKSTDKEQKYWAFTLFIFFLIYAGVSMFSYPKERITHNLLFTLALAFTYAQSKDKTLSLMWRFPFPQTSGIILLVIMSALSYHSWHMYRSDVHIKKAYQERALGTQKQYRHFKQAKSYFYPIDPNGTPLAWYQSYQNFAAGNLIMAEHVLKASLKAHPYHKNSLNDVGSVKFQLGKLKDARSYYAEALRISPRYVEANVNMAVCFIQMADFDSAWHYLAQCDTVNYHSNYHTVLSECTEHITVPFVAGLQDTLLAKTIERIYSNPKWMWLTHRHAIENNRTFRQQLVEEAVYLLSEMEMKIDLKHAQAIREQYNIVYKY